MRRLFSDHFSDHILQQLKMLSIMGGHGSNGPGSFAANAPSSITGGKSLRAPTTLSSSPDTEFFRAKASAVAKEYAQIQVRARWMSLAHMKSSCNLRASGICSMILAHSPKCFNSSTVAVTAVSRIVSCPSGSNISNNNKHRGGPAQPSTRAVPHRRPPQERLHRLKALVDSVFDRVSSNDRPSPRCLPNYATPHNVDT